MRFVVYKHSLILGDNNIVTKQLIALKHDDGTLQFTDFHRYVKSATKIKSISDDGNKRFSYVVKFLNFIYGTVGVNNLDQLTLEMVKEFFMLYGLGQLPEDRKNRKKSTVEKCVNAVLDFLTLYLNERKGKVKLKPKDLYSINTFTNRRGILRYLLMEATHRSQFLGICQTAPLKCFLLTLLNITRIYLWLLLWEHLLV